MPNRTDKNPKSVPAEPQSSRSEEVIFEAALALVGEQRADYLCQACGGDEQLREQVEKLLEANEKAGEFLDARPLGASTNKTVVVSVPVVEQVGQMIGRYKLREKLGEGGCGVVYVAEQTEPVRRRVALKIIKLGMDTRSVIARFEAERQALAMMDHPNIAKVLDAGTTDTGRPYFVMELVRGIRITDYCDQNHLDTTQRLELFMQVCHAIQHAHQKGVIHRDIKPSNILVTLHDGVPVPKVIDFGIAKATEGRLTDLTVYTELHQFIGTPAYMSPEQAEMSGLDIDTRSDIYSLGVLLYELLTGGPPFDPQELLRAGLDQMRRTIREKEPVRPSTRLSTMLDAELTDVAQSHSAEAPKLIHLIRGDLDWIVMKALEKDRTRRFETANGLAADVERFLKDEPVEARPPSNFYRLQKMVRRNATAFVAAGAVVCALVLGLGASLYLLVQERRALHRAVEAEKVQALLRQQAENGLALERRMRQIAPLTEKLSTAGLLLSQGLFDQAEEVMAQVPPVVPQSAAIYDVLGDQHARRGQWGAAMTNFAKAIQVDPTNHYGYHGLAPLLLETGDVQGYRQHRERVLRQFSATTDPTIAERMAKDCLVIAPAADQLTALIKMTDIAVGAGPTSGSWAYYEFVKGLAEYRDGHYAEASHWLSDVGNREDVPARTVEACAVLAMAQQRLNHPEQALTILARAEDLADTSVSKPNVLLWNDHIIAHLLLREAKALIRPDSAAGADRK